MSYGIRLRGSDRDLAALHALAAEGPALVDAPWTALTPPAGRLGRANPRRH